MSRFPAELVVTLTDGRTVTECFNQSEMAHFMREAALRCLDTREPLVLFDGEERIVPADQVAGVEVIVRGAALV